MDEREGKRVAPGKLAGLLEALLGRIDRLQLLDRLRRRGMRIGDRAIGIDDVAPLAGHRLQRQPDRPGFEFLRKVAGELLVAPASVLPHTDDAVPGIRDDELALPAAGRVRARFVRLEFDGRRAPDLRDVALDQFGDAIGTAFPDEDLLAVNSHLSSLYAPPLPFLAPGSNQVLRRNTEAS